MSVFEILLNREISGHFYSSCREEQDRLALLLHLPKKILFDELLVSYENAVIAVGHPELFQRITFNQRLEILGKHKPFVQIVLTHEEFMHQLNADNLRHLGRYDTELSQYIMNNLVKFHRLNEEERNTLINQGVRVEAELENEWQGLERVHQMLDEPSCYDELNMETLKAWGHDPDVALSILGKDELKTKMSRFNLCAYSKVEESAQVGKSFREICHFMTHSSRDIPENTPAKRSYNK